MSLGAKVQIYNLGQWVPGIVTDGTHHRWVEVVFEMGGQSSRKKIDRNKIQEKLRLPMEVAGGSERTTPAARHPDRQTTLERGNSFGDVFGTAPNAPAIESDHDEDTVKRSVNQAMDSFRTGDTVVVLDSFTSGKSKFQVTAGMQGIITELAQMEKGRAARIKFDNLRKTAWVKEKNFKKLKIIRQSTISKAGVIPLIKAASGKYVVKLDGQEGHINVL